MTTKKVCRVAQMLLHGISSKHQVVQTPPSAARTRMQPSSCLIPDHTGQGEPPTWATLRQVRPASIQPIPANNSSNNMCLGGASKRGHKAGQCLSQCLAPSNCRRLLLYSQHLFRQAAQQHQQQGAEPTLQHIPHNSSKHKPSHRLVDSLVLSRLQGCRHPGNSRHLHWGPAVAPMRLYMPSEAIGQSIGLPYCSWGTTARSPCLVCDCTQAGRVTALLHSYCAAQACSHSPTLSQLKIPPEPELSIRQLWPNVTIVWTSLYYAHPYSNSCLKWLRPPQVVHHQWCARH
jgi:hypothetical protein